MARTTKLVPPAKSGDWLLAFGNESRLRKQLVKLLTSKFVELQRESNRKEKELVSNSYEEGDGQIVVI